MGIAGLNDFRHIGPVACCRAFARTPRPPVERHRRQPLQVDPLDQSPKSIAVLATLDTKGKEAQFLRERIEAAGDRAVVIDTGVTGSPAARADITRQQVAAAGGTPWPNSWKSTIGSTRRP